MPSASAEPHVPVLLDEVIGFMGAADVAVFKRQFEEMEREVPRILGARGRQGQALVLPAYDHVLKASHLFNIMDARGAIAVAERQSYIGRIRDLCKQCAEAWVAQQGEAA